MLQDIERTKIALRDGKTEIALLDWGGEGPIALLHHANGFCGALWAGVVEFLRDRYRVVAMDARGHGDSSPALDMEGLGWNRLADDLAEVAEGVISAFGAGRIALGLGHSFGGSLMAATAALHPDFYERIALVDPVLFPPDVDSIQTRRNELVLRTRRRRRHWETRDAARDYLAARPLFEGWQPQSLDVYVAEGLRDLDGGGVGLKCAPEVEAEIFGGSHEIDLYGAADTLSVPTLVLRATRGDFPPDRYVDWVARMRHGRLEEIDGGHLIPMEDPHRVARAVLDFCNPPNSGGS